MTHNPGPDHATGDKAFLALFGGTMAEVLRTPEVRASVPEWHQRPTGPGLWLCMRYAERGGSVCYPRSVVLNLSQLDIDRGAPFETDECFGPIPKSEAYANAELALEKPKPHQFQARGESETSLGILKDSPL